MIAAFPCRAQWATLCLVDGGAGQLVLLELVGDCPGDPDARAARMTVHATLREALEDAATRVMMGWAEHACDRRVAPGRARAAVSPGSSFCLFPNPAVRQR